MPLLRIHISMLEPIEEEIHCTSKLKKFAYNNAYTLIIAAILFLILEITEVISIYVN